MKQKKDQAYLKALGDYAFRLKGGDIKVRNAGA